MTTAGPCLSGDAVPTGPGWLCPAPWCKAIKASHRRWLLGLPASWLCCLLGRLQHPLPRAPSFGPPRARGSCLVVGECRRPQGSLHLAPGRAAGAPEPWRRTGNRKEPRWRGRVVAPAAAETHAGLRPRRGVEGCGSPSTCAGRGRGAGRGGRRDLTEGRKTRESLIRSWARSSPGRQGTSPGTRGWGRRGGFTRCWDLGWETQAGKGTTGPLQGGKQQDRAGQRRDGVEGAPGGNL